MHVRLILEYDGTEYAGWQVQPQARTVQAVLEAALARLFGVPTRVHAAGRTDAGVHATGQVACFRTNRTLSPEVVQRALNALTPPDLAVRAVDLVDERFDARRSARGRTYLYRIWNRPVASPFWRRYAWHIRRPLAVEEMAVAAQSLLGAHDFTSFRAADCDAAHPVRQVRRSTVRADRALVSYEIEATAFLRHMVRNIVGTLVEVGLGRRAPADIPALLAARDRGRAAATAPAHGLCLTAVTYDGSSAATAGTAGENGTL
jgi:tRNA pseudouridine38-40 synthase